MATLLAIGYVVVRDPANSSVISRNQQVALFYIGGAVGGALFGLLLPATRTRLGGAWSGMLWLTPYFVGRWWLQGATLDLPAVAGVLAAIVVIGGLFGYWFATSLRSRLFSDEGRTAQ